MQDRKKIIYCLDVKGTVHYFICTCERSLRALTDGSEKICQIIMLFAKFSHYLPNFTIICQIFVLFAKFSYYSPNYLANKYANLQPLVTLFAHVNAAERIQFWSGVKIDAWVNEHENSPEVRNLISQSDGTRV